MSTGNNDGKDLKNVEVVEEEVETGPEAGGLVSAGVNSGVADQLYLAENIDKMIAAQNKIRLAILGLAQPGDWVIFGNKDTQKAEIGFAGAARIASTLGVSFTNWTATKEKGTDDKGEWYRWEFECDAIHGKRVIRVYGRAGSRDKFFGKKDGEFKPLSDVDEGNVKMAARRAAMKEGTKVLYGLHHMDPEFLKSKGVKLSSAGGYSFEDKDTKAEGTQVVTIQVDTITMKHSKPGETKKWTKYTINAVGGGAYSTFDEKIATTAKDSKESGAMLEVHFTKGQYGNDISAVELVAPQ